MTMLPIAVVDMDTRSSESPLRQPELARRLTGIDCYAIVEQCDHCDSAEAEGRSEDRP
jgi:hypothetical protein